MAILIPELSRQQQAAAVIDTETREHDRTHKPGDLVYIVSNSWFQSWCNFTGCTYDPQQRKLFYPKQDQKITIGPRPGPLDSSDLLDDSANLGDLTPEEFAEAAPLRRGLKEKQDFWMLHEATYNLLKGWYGSTKPEIRREHIQVGPSKRLELNHDQWHIKAIDEHSGRSVVVPTLKTTTASGLKDTCCRALDVDHEEYELASYQGLTGEPILVEGAMLHKTLISLKFQDRQAVLLRRKDHPEVAAKAAEGRQAPLPAPFFKETPAIAVGTSQIGRGAVTAPIAVSVGQLPSLTLPSSPLAGSTSPRLRLGTSPTIPSSSPLSRSFSKPPAWAEDAIIRSSGRRPGLAGLSNLGNTCFMNSSLQCLSHTTPLIRTFLSGEYCRDINRDNPLGLGGKLAGAFGGLMTKLWRGGVSYVSPKHFKWQLGKFAPQFGGYAQQDSQELLAFLLDGLHEDLNRIAIKPYKEEKDSDGRPDEEVAAEAWENYGARNDSVIVDHFQGLYKSTLRCPQCANQSVKFDPFMYLSLPLPSSKTRTLNVTVMDMNGAAPPIAVAIQVPKTGTVRTALAAVAGLFPQEEAQPCDDSVRDQWVLALWNYSVGSTKLQLLTDENASLDDLQLEPRRSYFLASPKISLLAYRYSSAASSDGGKTVQPRISSSTGDVPGLPVIIFHKAKRQTSLGPPTLLFVPNLESVDGKEKENSSEQFSIVPHAGLSGYWSLSQNNFLDAPFRAALTPIYKGTFPVPSGDGEEQGVVSKKPRSLPITDAKDVMPHPVVGIGIEDFDDQEGDTMMLPSTRPVSEAGEVADMELEKLSELEEDIDNLTQPVTPQHSLEGTPSSSFDGGQRLPEGLDMDPYFEVPGNAAEKGQTPLDVDTEIPGLDGGGKHTARAAEGASLKFSLDDESMTSKNRAPDSGPAHAHRDEGGGKGEWMATQEIPARPPYVLVLAQPSGGLKYSYGSTPPSLQSAMSGGILYLCAEWSEAGVAALDQSLWESPQQHESAQKAAAAAAAPEPAVTLNDCVEAFVQPERLDASDSWYCSKCKSHVQAEKQLDLWRLPDVLVVHLKRFSYSKYSRDKLDTAVDFPLEGFDLTRRVPRSSIPFDSKTGTTSVAPPVYDLYAVSNHYGGMGGGHYTAFCRMHDDGRWFTFDDGSVSEMRVSDVKTPAAYVLFYRRRGGEDPHDLEEIIASASLREDDGTLEHAGVVPGGFGPARAVDVGASLHDKSPPFTRRLGPALEQVSEELGALEDEGENAMDIQPAAIALHDAVQDESGDELNMEGIA